MTARVLLAAFDTPGRAAKAIRRLIDDGHTVREAYAPLPDETLIELIPERADWVRPVMLVGAVVGIAGGLLMQFWSATIGYPINSGGRALASWPAFVLVTFELGVLAAAVAGFVSLLWEAGLTRLHAPIFAAPGFERVSQDRVWVELQTDHEDNARALLRDAGALSIGEDEP